MDDILFHLAFPVKDLEAAHTFYVEGLGCQLGRTSSKALTLSLGGHQIIAHLDADSASSQKGVYPRHFGLLFRSEADWQALADRAKARRLNFYQQPRSRFPGSPLEHLTFFLQDPSGNLLEFKHYRRESAIFGEHHIGQVGDTEDVD